MEKGEEEVAVGVAFLGGREKKGGRGWRAERDSTMVVSSCGYKFTQVLVTQKGCEDESVFWQ